jgi:hypothetical protein
MAPAPLTTEERRELSDHFAALDSSGLETVRILAKHPMSGVFNSGASLIDALALAWTGGRGRGRAAWAAFVREFIGEDFVPLHDELRNPQLHNFSAAANIALTSGNKDRGLHRKTVGGFYHLHTDEFARDLETAFQNFRGRAQDDPVIGRRALSHFRRNAPVRAVPFYGGPANAASATGSTTVLQPSPRSLRHPPRTPGDMAVPKSRKRRRKRRQGS